MMKATWTGMALMLCVGLPAMSQDNATLQRNLDRTVELTADKLPLAEVFRKLSAATGVEFAIDESTYQNLPYGGQTKLAVQVTDVTLRNALTPILAPEALQWSVEGGQVRIMPSEPLYRLCRRATYDELALLGRILSAPGKISPSTKGEPSEQLEENLQRLREMSQCKTLEFKFVIPEEKLGAAVARAQKSLPAAGGAFLDALTSANDWTWYLDGERIVVLDRRKQAERQLAQQMTLKYQNESLAAVLSDLARKARVRLEIEPGVLQMLPAETRNSFNLRVTDATIAEALEVVSGGTGLVFTRTADGIRVEAGKNMLAGSATTRPRPSLMVRKTITLKDGSTVDLIIRGEDMPDDLRNVMEAEKARVIEEMRQKFVKTPATMPVQ